MKKSIVVRVLFCGIHFSYCFLLFTLIVSRRCAALEIRRAATQQREQAVAASRQRQSEGSAALQQRLNIEEQNLRRREELSKVNIVPLVVLFVVVICDKYSNVE